MLRTFRNLIVNIMAAFIRDREARHKFRNKYKRKSKFRKLRDDNRILFNESATIKHEIKLVKKNLESLQTKYYFKYSAAYVAKCKDFYEQIKSEELPDKYRSLVKDLDEDSIKCVSQILCRIKLVSEQDPGRGGILDIFTEEEKAQLEKLRKEFRQHILQLTDDCWAYRKYLLPTNRTGPSTLYYKHQIPYLHNIEKLKNKDFLDVGCYIGNSALVFTEYTNGKIYSFEPTTINYDLTLKTIEMNRCKNVIPVKIALGAKDEELPIKIQGGASTLTRNTTVYLKDSPTETIRVTTLDNFVKGKDINVGLIKVDIEGFEQEFLKGAEQTIRKFRPTMLLSIYHNASDFFDIKPIIESWGLGYKFQVSRPVDGGIRDETILICEVI